MPTAVSRDRLLPLANHTTVDTRDPGAAQDEVGRIFCAHRLTPRRPGAPHFHAIHNNARHDGFSVNYVAYGADVEIDPGRLDRFFLVQVPLVGGAEVRCGGTLVEASPDRATLLSPTLPTRMHWTEGTAKLIVLVEREVMESTLAALLERSIARVEFDPAIPLDRPTGAAIRSLVALMQSSSEAADPRDRFASVHTQLRDALVGLMLASQPHGHSAELARPAPLPAPVHVRRAEDFMAAHAHERLTAIDVAAAAGVGVRTLQSGFRRFRDRTIGELLLDLRLEEWRRALTDPGLANGVGDLGLSVGLPHPGRAAAAYRRRYGETPSQTRRRIQSS